MFTDHKKFAAAPPTGGVSAEEKQALVGEPVVYGLPAKPKDGPARVVYEDEYVALVIHGVVVHKSYRRPYYTSRYEDLAFNINNAAKEKGL